MQITTADIHQMQFPSYSQPERLAPYYCEEKNTSSVPQTNSHSYPFLSPISSAASSVGSSTYSTSPCHSVVSERQGAHTELDDREYHVNRPGYLVALSHHPSICEGQDVATSHREYAKGCPLFAAGGKRYADLSYFDRSIRGVNSSPSPSIANNSIESAAALANNVWSSSQNTFTSTAEGLVWGVCTFDTVAGTIKILHNLLQPLGYHVRMAAEEELRLHVMYRFAKIWHPIGGNRFLTFAEYDDLVTEGLQLTLRLGQKERLNMTLQGMAYIEFMGRLLDAKILTGCDIALAAETLLRQRKEHGYMRALFLLVRKAGDKICRKDSLHRFLKIMDNLHQTSEIEIDNNYEFKLFCRPILSLLSEYREIQAIKTLKSQPRNKKA